MPIIRARFAIGLLAVLIAAGLAAAAPQAYTLRLHQGEGGKATYAFTATTKGKVTTSDQGTQNMSSVANLKYVVEFLGVSPDDSLLVQGETLGGTLAVKQDKKSQTVPVEDSVVNYILTPRADIKEVDLLSGTPASSARTGMFYGPDKAFWVVPLPSKPVKVGDRWQGTADLPVFAGEPGQTSQFKYDSVVLGQVAFGGRNCLKIKSNLRQSLETSAAAPDGSGTAQVKLHASAVVVWLFDPKDGVVVKSDLTGTADVTAVVQGASIGEQTGRAKVSLDEHAKLTAFSAGRGAPAE